MTKLSLWAKQHTETARLIIAILHILLIILAVYSGISLAQLGIALPAAVEYIVIVLSFAVIFFYPAWHKKDARFNKRQLYIIRKSCEFVLGASSFILICSIVNHYDNNIFISDFTVEAAQVSKGGEKPTAATILGSLAYRDKSTLTKTEKKVLRNEFKHQLKVYVRAKLAKDDDAGLRALFIILSIIGALSLIFLLAGLGCGLACDGSGAAAVLVVLIGLIGIIWLLTVVIKKIQRHHKKEDPEKPQAEKTA